MRPLCQFERIQEVDARPVNTTKILMMNKGICVSPTEFFSFAELNKPTREAIALCSCVGGTMNFSGYLPNPDPVLCKIDKSIEFYRDLMSDTHVGDRYSSP